MSIVACVGLSVIDQSRRIVISICDPGKNIGVEHPEVVPMAKYERAFVDTVTHAVDYKQSKPAIDIISAAAAQWATVPAPPSSSAAAAAAGDAGRDGKQGAADEIEDPSQRGNVSVEKPKQETSPTAAPKPHSECSPYFDCRFAALFNLP